MGVLRLRRGARGRVQRVRRGRRVLGRGRGMLGVVGRFGEDGVHLLVKAQDGDVRGRGHLLRARRLGRQLLVTDVLCLLWRTVGHVGGGDKRAEPQQLRADTGWGWRRWLALLWGGLGQSTQEHTQTLGADGLTVLAVVRRGKRAENAAMGVEMLTERSCYNFGEVGLEGEGAGKSADKVRAAAGDAVRGRREATGALQSYGNSKSDGECRKAQCSSCSGGTEWGWQSWAWAVLGFSST